MACPTIPPVPQEVLMRFRTMRDWDMLMRRFSSDLCASIPAPVDLTSILARLDALEASLATLWQRVVNIESTITTITGTSGSFTWVVVNTTPYTVTTHNVGLLVSTSTSAISITLPFATDWDGETIYIKDNDGNAGTNNITITPSGTDTIDDDATLVIDSDYAGAQLKSNGSGWEIV